MGRVYIVFAALLWSTSGFFAKAPMFAGWSGLTLAFWRALFAGVLLLAFVRRAKFSWRLLPMIICFVGMNFTFLEALVISPGNAIWLQNTAPTWCVIFGLLFMGERPTRRDSVLLLLSVAGVGLILAFELSSLFVRSESSSVNSSGGLCVILGMLSGVMYAGVILSLRSLKDFDPGFLVATNHLASAVALFPFVYVLTEARHPIPTGLQWIVLACFGMLQMGIPYILFARGLQTTPSHEASAIGLIEPILVPLWAYLAWNVHSQWWTIVGGVLILIGLATRYLPESFTSDRRRPLWPTS